MRVLTPDEQAELEMLQEACLKKDGNLRKDADPEDVKRLNELLTAIDKPVFAISGEEPTKNQTPPPAEIKSPADVQAVVFMANLPIVGYQVPDEHVVFDLGDGHKITAGCIRQAKKLLGI